MENIHSIIKLEHLKLVLLFAIGFTMGYTYLILTSLESREMIKGMSRRPNIDVNGTNSSQTVFRANFTNHTIDEVKEIRILCYLHTSPKFHATKAIHIRETWGRHCDKLIFASTSTDLNLRATGFNVTDSHDHLWGKTKLMMQHIYSEFIDDYDWFFKGDDDTFLIPENLRYLLSAYSTDDPIYFGFKFNTTNHTRGYFAGGSGYAMSHKTVRIFVENVLTNQDFLKKNKNCHVYNDKEIEDAHISMCLDQYNVYAGDARDLSKRERFVTLNPEDVFSQKKNKPHWYWRMKYYSSEEGAACCSNYMISFHYIIPKYEYTMYYLTYGLHPYGVVRRFPPTPQKEIFSEVAELLDLQRFNKTLRGF